MLTLAALSSPTVADERPSTLGVRAGIEMGGRTTAGGATIAGEWAEQVTDQWWFDTQARFVFGQRANGCGNNMCSHGVLSGFAAELMGGGRIFFKPNWWARASAGARYTEFAVDDVSGFSILFRGDVGWRFLAGDMALDVSAGLFAGPGWFEEARSEPQFGGGLSLGVALDL